MVGQTKGDFIIAKIDDVVESVKRANLDGSKQEAIIENLKAAKRETIRDERSFEKEKKIKGRLLKASILSAMLVMGAIIDEEYFGFLSPWISKSFGNLFVVILILMMLTVAYYERDKRGIK